MFENDAEKLFFRCIVEGDVVRVGGEIDLNTAPTLYEALLSCAKELGRLPTVDFSDVVYFDSSGAKALINAEKLCPNEDEPMRIVGVQPDVLRIMNLIGLTEYFDVSESKKGGSR